MGTFEIKSRLRRLNLHIFWKAILTAKGRIKLGNKKFDNPTVAAKMIVDTQTVNGWNFLYVENASREWVRLGELKG